MILGPLGSIRLDLDRLQAHPESPIFACSSLDLPLALLRHPSTIGLTQYHGISSTAIIVETPPLPIDKDICLVINRTPETERSSPTVRQWQPCSHPHNTHQTPHLPRGLSPKLHLPEPPATIQNNPHNASATNFQNQPPPKIIYIRSSITYLPTPTLLSNPIPPSNSISTNRDPRIPNILQPNLNLLLHPTRISMTPPNRRRKIKNGRNPAPHQQLLHAPETVIPRIPRQHPPMLFAAHFNLITLQQPDQICENPSIAVRDAGRQECWWS